MKSHKQVRRALQPTSLPFGLANLNTFAAERPDAGGVPQLKTDQLAFIIMFDAPNVLDIQNRKLQTLLDEGWRVVQVIPGGGGGMSPHHSFVFLLERRRI